MINYVVFFKTEPHFVKCVTKKDALTEASKRHQEVIAVVTADGKINIKIPQLAMQFEEDVLAPIEDYVGEELMEQLEDVNVGVNEMLGLDSVEAITHKEQA